MGGCVRDLLLGYEPKDFDISTNALPEQVHKLFRRSRLIGRRFKLVHVRFGRDEIIEVATFRAPPEAEAIAQLEGVPLPASVLERDVLPARVRGYAPRLLDELGAAGEVVWVGRVTLGRDDGRVALYRRDRVELLASAGTAEDRPAEPVHDAIRAHLQRRGASFFPQLRAAVADARSDDELLDALWDLVWAGEVTNDTFAALRALSLPRSRSKATPRPGRLVALGPPRAAGRWSLVADLVGEGADLGVDPGALHAGRLRHGRPRGAGELLGGEQLLALEFRLAKFTKAAARPQAPFGTLYFFAALAAEFRLIEHLNLERW